MDSARGLPKGRGFPIRTSADQRSLASPRGFSQRATSFIASRRQGIHRTPLSRSGPTDRRGRHRLPHAGPSRRAPEGERTGLVPRGKAVARPPRPGDARTRALTGTPPKRPTHTLTHSRTHTSDSRARGPGGARTRASSNKHNRSRFTCERTRRRLGVRASPLAGPRTRRRWFRRIRPADGRPARADRRRAWRRSDSNRRPPACKAGALPAELRPRRRRPAHAAGRHGPGRT